MYKELVEKLRHRGTLYNGISLFDDAPMLLKSCYLNINFANMTKKETDITLKNEVFKMFKIGSRKQRTKA